MSTAAKALPEFADEIVTQSLVRYVSPPGMNGEVALITLDNGRDHKRPSTFGPAGLASLDAALDEIFAHHPPVRAIAVTGKPYVFAVGADLSGMKQLRSRDDAVAIAQRGHEVFRRLRDSPIPTFAFVNGAALGGGLELALHCHHRTLSTTANTIAFPECAIGLVPGWGGCWLLPNLIGPEKALKVILENPLSQNRMLRAQQAFELGIADALLEPADFLESSMAWATSVLNGEIVVERPEVDHGDGWDTTVLFGQKLVDERMHGAAPAPYRALELIAAAKTTSYDDGAAAEERSPRRSPHQLRAACQPVRIRSGAETGSETSRRTGPVVGP